MTRDDNTITCRAQIDPACQDGYTVPAAEERDWRDDGTYQQRDDSIVCDACYVALLPHTPSRRGRTDEIADAIERIRDRQRGAP